MENTQETPRPIEEITQDLDSLIAEVEAAPPRDEYQEIRNRLDEIFGDDKRPPLPSGGLTRDELEHFMRLPSEDLKKDRGELLRSLVSWRASAWRANETGVRMASILTFLGEVVGPGEHIETLYLEEPARYGFKYLMEILSEYVSEGTDWGPTTKEVEEAIKNAA